MNLTPSEILITAVLTFTLGLTVGYFFGFNYGRNLVLDLWRKSDHDAVFKPEPRLGVLDDHAE